MDAEITRKEIREDIKAFQCRLLAAQNILNKPHGRLSYTQSKKRSKEATAEIKHLKNLIKIAKEA